MLRTSALYISFFSCQVFSIFHSLEVTGVLVHFEVFIVILNPKVTVYHMSLRPQVKVCDPPTSGYLPPPHRSRNYLT